MRLIPVYQFNELSKEAQQKAVERLREVNTDFGCWEVIFEDAKMVGLNITSFELYRNCEGKFTLSAHEVAANIIRDFEEGGMLKSALAFNFQLNSIQNEFPELEGADYEAAMQMAEDTFRRQLLKDYLKRLEAYCDYLISDEGVIDTIEANEWEFLEDGRMI